MDSQVNITLNTIATTIATTLFRTSRDSGDPPQLAFDLGPIVQLNVMESLGILIFRTEKCKNEPGAIYVYRY